MLTDIEKYQLLTTVQESVADDDLDTRSFTVGGGKKRKRITFQKRWIQEHNWLRYGTKEGYRGGWCLPCILFLSEGEKASLGVFIKTPFVNYNKSQ